MLKKISMLLLVMTLFGVLIGGSPPLGQAQPEMPEGGPVASRGPRMGFFTLFNTLRAGDLVILQNGGQLGGTVEQENFTISNRTISRDEILLISWGAAGEAAEESPTAKVLLKDGSQLQGTLESSSITVRLSIGESVTLAQGQLRGIIFQLELPEGAQMRRLHETIYPLFRGLQGTALLQVILEGLQKFDLLIFPDGGVLSVDIENEEFTLDSPIFGVYTLAVADIAQIIFDDPDWLVLKIGDQVSGTVTPDGGGAVRATAITGSALSLTKDELGGITFRLPEGSLGGGGKPHFQPGPGK